MGRMMKATVHNGRATKGGLVYNANHNTKTETRDQEGHIDHSRTEQNINLQFTNEGRVRRCGSFDAKEFELSRYEHLYAEGQEAKNARYIADGHPKRCKTVADIYESRRTAPLETILQIGSYDTDIDPQERKDLLMGATVEWIDRLQKRWGDNLHFQICEKRGIVIDREVKNPSQMPGFGLEHENRSGQPGRTSFEDDNGKQPHHYARSSRAMGIQRPDPTAKESKYNCPLITFSEIIRNDFEIPSETRTASAAPSRRHYKSQI